MKRLLKTIAKKWPEYLIEAIVIVASILGAFALEEWKEEKQNKEQYRTALEFVKNDLLQDIAEIDSAMVRYNRTMENLRAMVYTQVSLDSLESRRYVRAINGYEDISIEQRGINLLHSFIEQHQDFNLELSNELAFFYSEHLEEVNTSEHELSRYFFDFTDFFKSEDWYFEISTGQPDGFKHFAQYAYANKVFKKRLLSYAIQEL